MSHAWACCPYTRPTEGFLLQVLQSVQATEFNQLNYSLSWRAHELLTCEMHYRQINIHKNKIALGKWYSQYVGPAFRRDLNKRPCLEKHPWLRWPLYVGFNDQTMVLHLQGSVLELNVIQNWKLNSLLAFFVQFWYNEHASHMVNG